MSQKLQSSETEAYQSDSTVIAQGITFHLPSRRRFIPYSWLLHAEMNQAETELYLQYNHCVVTILPRYLPPDACMDDPVDKLDPLVNGAPSPFAMASYGLTRIKEWAARGGTKQRALRHDLVTLCMCPQFLPCKHPSAAWCGRQHGVSREYASRLCREFAREFGDYLQFRGQRFLNHANTTEARRGRGRRGELGPKPGPVVGG